MNMNIDEAKKHHGYLALPRHTKILQKDLGHRLFSLHLALIMNARWFRGNPFFCRVVGTQAEIAKEIDTTQSNLSRDLDQLQKKGYLLKRKRYIILKYFPLFLPDIAKKIHSNDYANSHELYEDVYKINAKLQEKYAESQDQRDQNAPQSLNSSSKDNLGFSQESSYQIDIDEIAEDIEKQKREGNL